MKKVFLLLIVLSSILLLSCSKNKDKLKADNIVSKEVDSTVDYENIYDEREEEIIEPVIPCVMFYDSASIWNEDSDGKLVWQKILYAGQELLAYPSSSEILGEELLTREFSRENHEDTKEVYTKIFYNNKEYWINSHVIAPYTKPGIVIGTDAIVYKTPDNLDVGNILIPQFQFVAVDTNFNSPSDGEIEFTKVTFRSEEHTCRNVFIKTSVLSENSDDIIAYKLLNKAAIIENRNSKKELLENCKSLNLSESMKQKLMEDTETILYEYQPETETQEDNISEE